MARQYRDALVAKLEPMLRAEFANVLRKNNTSGVPGVCLIRSPYKLADGTRREVRYWEAIWPTEPGCSETRRFSVATHGNKGAFELACAARAQGLSRVSGYFWASEAGAPINNGAVNGKLPLAPESDRRRGAEAKADRQSTYGEG